MRLRNKIMGAVLAVAVAGSGAGCEPEEENNNTGGEEVVACDPAPGVICTFMGKGKAGLGHDGVSPREVLLYLPQDVSFGPDGRPYVLDWNNHRIRTVQDDKVITVLGTGELGDAPKGKGPEISLNHPTHVAFDPAGNLILSAWHNSKILRMNLSTLDVEPICGTGGRDFGGDGGPAEMAILDLPVATAFDSKGRMLIMDQANQRVRRVEEDGTIMTVVGPDKSYLPAGLVKVTFKDKDGNDATKVCKEEEAVDPQTCVAQTPPKPQGFSGDGGDGSEAMLYLPFSQSAPPAGRMEMGPGDRLFIADTGNQRIRVWEPDGVIHTVAGSGPDTYDPKLAGAYAGDGGPATEAKFSRPVDVAVSSDGTLYIADTDNHCIRKVDAKTQIITTFAGQCGKKGFDGDGQAATSALLYRPYGVALDKDENLYIADTHNHRIRVVYKSE
ncbi:MAG: hypothetical protein HUU55_17695 [Myxococcales bacterium]|nr:hypothetical protein [Myxococcales bacterium]